MTQMALLNLILYISILLVAVKPLGWYMARVYTGKPCGLNKIIDPIERAIMHCCGINRDQAMDWRQYLTAMLYFNLLGLLVVYLLQRWQFFLPFNPQAMPAIKPVLAFNTAISFATNTDWQAYSGEAMMSYFTQMLGFTVQNFLSAATGMSLLIAFIRGLARSETSDLGNFWTDTVRGILYILLPLSLVFSVVLVSQGVIQNYKSYQEVSLIDVSQQTTQIIAMGPVASQEAIKLLGSNGGGFFNTNSAHPFENPNTLTNFLEMLALVLIPASLCYTFGLLVNDRRQGWMLLLAMILIFVPAACVNISTEYQGNPLFDRLEIINSGNMEGKETRLGITNSALWATATTASGTGAVNAMHDSLMPVSNLVCLVLMYLGEIIFGGVGSGLYGMLVFVIITVFIAGLMVGRTPEYLGKKIEPFEMKMVVLIVLVLPLLVLILTAIASVTSMGTASLGNPGAQGLMEMLYAFTSMRSNNGSALAGLITDTDFYNITGGLLMLINRYGLAIATLAIAGALARKKIIPASAGTLATHSYLFLMLLIGVIIIVGALSFLPTLALGPIIEHLNLWKNYGH